VIEFTTKLLLGLLLPAKLFRLQHIRVDSADILKKLRRELGILVPFPAILQVILHLNVNSSQVAPKRGNGCSVLVCMNHRGYAWPHTRLHNNVQARLQNRTSKRVVLDLGAEDIRRDQITKGGKPVLAILDADVPTIQPLLVDAVAFDVQVTKGMNR
jgi:hypothetical protein